MLLLNPFFLFYFFMFYEFLCVLSNFYSKCMEGSLALVQSISYNINLPSVTEQVFVFLLMQVRMFGFGVKLASAYLYCPIGRRINTLCLLGSLGILKFYKSENK